MKKALTIRIDEDVLERMKQAAEEERRSQSNWIELAIESKLDSRGEK